MTEKTFKVRFPVKNMTGSIGVCLRLSGRGKMGAQNGDQTYWVARLETAAIALVNRDANGRCSPLYTGVSHGR